ncbi:MAG: cell division protein FtsA [Muribaculaceae bacterium]|nr:cell division protein FtsA [Muribaculaceae bacterium]
MNQQRYIAAIEISSSKVIGAIGVTSGAGQLEILAVEQEHAVASVRYGQIHNLEETSMRIGRILDRLEQHPAVSPRRIKSLYVGLSGRSLRSIPVTVKLDLADDTEVSDEIISRLREDALRTAIDNTLEVVDAVPRTYHVGKTETQSPKGMVGNSISATFDIIVCRPEMRRNIVRTLTDKLNLRIEGFVITALACGHLILSNEEKRLGCMLADIGAETTTVTIYSHGCLRYFATLPMGGRNITLDLTSLHLLEEKAEDIKITSCSALAREGGSSINLNGLRSSDISNLVVARSEEIVANILEQVTYAGLSEKDIAGGIVCIGGGSRLDGITELLSRQSGLQAHWGQLPNYVTVSDHRASSAEITEVASVLYAAATLGNVECLAEPKKEELPVTGEAPEETPAPPEESEQRPRRERSKIMGGFARRLAKIFAPPEEDDDDSDIID